MVENIEVDKVKLYGYFEKGLSIDYICSRSKLTRIEITKYLQEYVRESTIRNVSALFEKEHKKKIKKEEVKEEILEEVEEVKYNKRKYNKRKAEKEKGIDESIELKKPLSKTKEKELRIEENKEKKRLKKEQEEKEILDLIGKGVKPTQIAEITGINVQRVRDFCRQNYSYNNYIIKAEGEENCKAIIEIKNREISYQSLKIEKLGERILKLEEKIDKLNIEKRELLKLLNKRNIKIKIDY